MADVRDLLRTFFGHVDFRPHQEQCVRALLAGDDLLAVLATAILATNPHAALVTSSNGGTCTGSSAGLSR